MTEKDLDNFRAFFADYVRSFSSQNFEDQKNISLKEEHSLMVCRTSRVLAKAEHLPHEKILIAESIGLLHDIGRFPQYARYKTFRDNISVNHGALGAEILSEKDVLGALPPEEQRTVLNAVRFHNAFAVPRLPDTVDIFFLRLIRDADKLDIWRIFLGFFENGTGDMTSVVGLGLPETQGYSKEAIACIRDGKPVTLSHLTSLNDLKLMQLSWVYGLNLPASFALLAESDIIHRLIALLPDTGEIREVEALLTGHASRMRKDSPDDRKCAGGEPTK